MNDATADGEASATKNALIATLITYLVMAAAFFAIGRCAF